MCPLITRGVHWFNEEISIENYVEAIANEIGPSTILFVNIKNVYLRSITYVQELGGSNLFINSKQSNINYLPNSVLLPYLNKYGVVKFKPSYLTAGFGGKLGHIKSFRRKCEMVFSDDVKFIGEHFDIQFGSIIDRPVCYTCEIIGHISRHCDLNLDIRTKPYRF